MEEAGGWVGRREGGRRGGGGGWMGGGVSQGQDFTQSVLSGIEEASS